MAPHFYETRLRQGGSFIMFCTFQRPWGLCLLSYNNNNWSVFHFLSPHTSLIMYIISLSNLWIQPPWNAGEITCPPSSKKHTEQDVSWALLTTEPVSKLTEMKENMGLKLPYIYHCTQLRGQGWGIEHISEHLNDISYAFIYIRRKTLKFLLQEYLCIPFYITQVQYL